LKEKEGLIILAASFDDKIDINYLALTEDFYKARTVNLLKRDYLIAKYTHNEKPQRDK